MVHCLGCTRRVIQFVLIGVNIFVALLGMTVMIIGIWAKTDDRKYFEIADVKDEFNQVTVLMIVVGVFVLLIGAVGAVGALFASYVFGRVVLVLYAIVLSLLIICEIAGGIAAAVYKDNLESEFRDSANQTLTDYNNTKDTWDDFQRDFECCGVDGYMDYRSILGPNMVPLSCCDDSSLSENVTCTDVSQNATTFHEYIYSQGCVDAVIGTLKDNIAGLAAGAIVIGLVQIAGVVLACFVAIYKGPQQNKYEVV